MGERDSGGVGLSSHDNDELGRFGRQEFLPPNLAWTGVDPRFSPDLTMLPISSSEQAGIASELALAENAVPRYLDPTQAPSATRQAARQDLQRKLIRSLDDQNGGSH
jgi:hypothetical protein